MVDILGPFGGCPGLIQINFIRFPIQRQSRLLIAFEYDGAFDQQLSLFAQLSSLDFERNRTAGDLGAACFADRQFTHARIDLGIKMGFVANF